MSIYVLIIFLILFAIGIGFMVIKKKKVSALNEMLKEQRYDDILRFVNEKRNMRFLNTYIRDLYSAKVYVLKNDMDALKKHLRVMFNTQYSKNDTIHYLTLYCHFFIQRKDGEFADEVIEEIKKLEDRPFTQYCVWAKEVIIDGRNDLIEDMQAAIDRKEYHSFPIGVVAYLIGLQKLSLEEYEEALEFFEACLDVMQPNDIYVSDIKKEIKDLID